MKLPLSICIIAYNEEKNLQRLLPQIQSLGAEIVVIDAQSSDRTVEIARQYGATIYTEEWRGFVAQKQLALDKCTQPWILMLDCDELPDERLLQSIAACVKRTDINAGELRRQTVYLGRTLRHAWQPDRHIRLVHRAVHPHIVGHNGHDRLELDPCTPLALEGTLLHYSYRDIRHHFEKTIFYARLGADDYTKRGIRFSLLNLIINPVIAFIKLYIIRKAFLDGIPGLLAGLSTWLHVFLKYAMLWEAELKAKN